MKVLFLEPYPIEGPSSRYRVEQYIPFLKANGIDCTVRPFVSSHFYRILYTKGHFIQKLFFFITSSFRRLRDLYAALQADIVFIHLEAFPIGPPLFEYLIALLGKKIIYDFDDAIYLGNTSPTNSFLKKLKCPGKVKHIIRLSRHVITCNPHLHNYAKQFNTNVTILFTSVDTEKFFPLTKTPSDTPLRIGWIGSHSTAVYLDSIKNCLARLSQTYNFTVTIVGASNHPFDIPGIEIRKIDWSLQDEVRQFQALDIGIYPLSNNEWAFGKGGFKAIQYMSVGIPCVVSGIGVNKDIIIDGINGFLAVTEDAWFQKLSQLINDPGLRERIGLQGRKSVLENYSLEINAPRLLQIIKDTINNSK